MKFSLFCENPYAYDILAPLRKVLIEKEYDFIWFLPEKLLTEFPFKEEKHTTDIYIIDKSTIVIFSNKNKSKKKKKKKKNTMTRKKRLYYTENYYTKLI